MALAIMVAAPGCMSPPPELPHAQLEVNTTLPEHPVPPPEKAPGFPQLGGVEPGSLIDSSPFDLIDPRITISGATAYRIKYMSTSAINGEPVEVGGVVLFPGGRAPDNGWEVIAFNHGNTGIDKDCGPSLYDDLLNQWLPISVLLLHGYVVVASDYEGLSGTPAHAFLNAAALGRNVIDGVRATRHIRPDVGKRWAAFGGSLGGLATWAANEQASTYGTDLDLVGAAAWVPVVDVSGLPAKAMAGTMTHDQLHLYFLAIMGLKRTTQPDMDLQRFMRGTIYDNRDILMVCNGPGVIDALEVLRTANPDDLKPVDQAAEEEMTGWLKELAVPKQPMAAPMLVLYGSVDQLVDQAWVEQAIAEGCGMGDDIQWLLRVGEGHGDIDAAMAFPWIRERFDNQAPQNRCLTPPVP
ncbi:MAG: lipase family protein [Mycobacterium sp.]